jgi:3-deoxy-manno-octulosonate cytidylyltransferase (CMP-KDO synthetase)
MNNNKFVVIIPARMNSTRLANKMIKEINNIPLIIYTARQALASNAQKVVVATDHPIIYDLCKIHNVDVVMTSSEHKSGTERIIEAAKTLGLNEDEVIINVQGDEPLIEPQLINDLASFIIKNKFAMATIAHPLNNYADIINPNVVKVVLDNNANALYFSRSAIPYYRDGFTNIQKPTLPQNMNILRHFGVYGYTVKFLNLYANMKPSALEQVEALEQLRVLYNGHKIAVMITTKEHAPGVDSEADFIKVQQILQGKKNNVT